RLLRRWGVESPPLTEVAAGLECFRVAGSAQVKQIFLSRSDDDFADDARTPTKTSAAQRCTLELHAGTFGLRVAATALRVATRTSQYSDKVIRNKRAKRGVGRKVTAVNGSRRGTGARAEARGHREDPEKEALLWRCGGERRRRSG